MIKQQLLSSFLTKKQISRVMNGPAVIVAGTEFRDNRNSPIPRSNTGPHDFYFTLRVLRNKFLGTSRKKALRLSVVCSTRLSYGPMSVKSASAQTFGLPSNWGPIPALSFGLITCGVYSGSLRKKFLACSHKNVLSLTAACSTTKLRRHVSFEA